MERPAFSSLAASTRAYGMLKSDFASGNVSHAYLFVSPDRLLISLLSRMFAALCITGDETGEASILAQNGLHADVMCLPVSADGEKRRETVLTADIDGIIESLYYKPSAGDRKFYIIDYGETMNASCQNKLLKTLEEPPPSAFIIINAADESPLLSTVVSRCRKIVPETFSSDRLEAAMRERYPHSDRIDAAVSASRGMLSYCERMISDAGYARAFDTAAAVLLTLKSSKNALVNAAKILGQKDRIEETIEFLEILLRDVAVLHSGEEQLIMCKSYAADIERIAAEFSADAVMNIMPALYRAKKRLRLNGNQTGIVDELMLSMAKCKALYK